MTDGKRRQRKLARPGRPPRDERDARRTQRRTSLVDAAMAAIDGEGPAVTMTRMAAEAGVTKPVLYRYFGDRAGLYEAVAARFAEDLLEELRRALDSDLPPRTQLEAGIDAYLAHIERHPSVYRFLTQRLPAEDPEGQRLVTGFMRRVAAEIVTVLGERLRRAGADSGGAELLGYGITGMVHLAGEAWLDRPTMPRGRAVSYLAGVLWRGLAGTEERRSPGDGHGAVRPARSR